MVRRSARLSTAGRAGAGQKRQRPEIPTPTPKQPGESSSSSSPADGHQPAVSKRRKVAAASRSGAKKPDLHPRLFSSSTTADPQPCLAPARLHSLDYHRPLLLSGHAAAEHRRSLLSWFDSVSTTRAMPWRKPWIDPALSDDPVQLRRALEVRAYEIWISEIMLQQTRVAVVVDYWNRWMACWPTIRDLARAHADHVLAAWRGLGYYSRATRIHDAAKLVVDDPEMRGLLPATPADLAARVPGVGRYTAGAISAIVFGRAEPMVDGNVLRVLSRQLGIYANAKADKAVIDAVWAAADALVKAVADDGEASVANGPVSLTDRPGRWGQALMELGSTVCTPKPDCSSCPITSTCRVYNEGKAFANGAGMNDRMDMEDLCGLCLPFEETIGKDGPLQSKADERQAGPNRLSLADFGFQVKDGSNASSVSPRKQPRSRKGASAGAIADYARRFPAKIAKKARRLPKGLLAGLWELPSTAMSSSGSTSAKKRTQLARSHAATLVKGSGASAQGLVHVGELGSVPWLFSHIKLTMHVHLFLAAQGKQCDLAEGRTPTQPRRWSRNVDDESMGTGMRKCWALVRDVEASEPD
ncbi:hhH-GPD superfamily base excision DNA repair protein [Hirsutella rhossiliensis]|uniref:Adenine DNA glycosylase n=1 Tax=Hirsutella rhossiliensis TaxID=111463 RepID=A0A9P8SKA5_9HYPO|nr:hhH-GPD superfamily base excision DNA repair protein [Hirsutella rhossiliensis]KAH0966153.1 hhH-GPD superfamily base excision DNA repair protein [Hirsutella rhossiliensis]